MGGKSGKTGSVSSRLNAKVSSAGGGSSSAKSWKVPGSSKVITKRTNFQGLHKVFLKKALKVVTEPSVKAKINAELSRQKKMGL